MPAYISLEAQDLISCLLKKNPLDRIPLNKVLEHPFMTKKHSTNTATTTPLMPHLGINGVGSQCFKPIVSFNESMDSGRGTMTSATPSNNSRSTTTTTSSQQQQNFLRNRNVQETNLATLQSGQEEDFSCHAGDSTNNSTRNNNTNTNSNDTTNDTTTSSASLFMNQQQGFQAIKNTKLAAASEAPSEDTKNLYYNRFIKQQSSLPTPPVPPSPPVKLSSYSPTKQKPLSQQQQQQQQQLISSSSTSLSTATSSNSNNWQGNNSSSSIQNQSAQLLLSRSNVHLNSSSNNGGNYPMDANNYNYSNNTSNGKHFIETATSGVAPVVLNNRLNGSHTGGGVGGGGGGYNISRKNSIIPSAISLENINSASSLTDAEHMPTSISPSPIFYKQNQHLNHQANLNGHHSHALQYQSDDSSSYPLSSSASKHTSALKKKQRKKTEEVNDVVQKPLVQNTVSPLKTGATLLRPTRQASKNAVVSFQIIP